MGHIVTVMVDGDKLSEFELDVGREGWEHHLAAGLKASLVEAVAVVLQHEDDELQRSRPAGWENLGREVRTVLTVVGEVRVRRRVYRDARGQRRKPLDERLGWERYERVSPGVQQIGAYLASQGSYRHAAGVASWMLNRPVSAMRIGRLAWKVGLRLEEQEEEWRRAVFERGVEVRAGKIPAEILYAEADEVLIALQRERKRKARIGVGIYYTGKERVAHGRNGLTDKTCVTQWLDGSERWRETFFLHAYGHYALTDSQLIVLGGDGGQLVRHSADCFERPTIYQLDPYHIYREARRALPNDQGALSNWIARCRQQGLEAMEEEFLSLMAGRSQKVQEKLRRFWRYVQNNADGLVDYRVQLGLDPQRYPSLGAIEGNVDKLVVQRMKGRGMSWRKPGAIAMLALLRHKQALAAQALPPTPATRTSTARRQAALSRRQRQASHDPSWLQAHIPALHGPSENQPWTQKLKRLINGEPRLPVAYSRP